MRVALAACLTLLLVTSAEAVCTFDDGPPVNAPVYTLYAGPVQLTIWRGDCVTVLVTPLEGSVEVGPLTITQGSDVRQTRLVTGYSTFLGTVVPDRLMGPLTGPLATVIDFDLEPGPDVDLDDSFSIALNGAQRLIPGAATPLSITLEADGCSPCSAGEVASFHADIANPLTPFTAGVVAGVVFPNGTTSAWFSTMTSVATGVQRVELPEIVVPAGAPNGTYTLQIVLIDLSIGTTLARGLTRVEKD
jgi:hypothetical protein